MEMTTFRQLASFSLCRSSSNALYTRHTTLICELMLVSSHITYSAMSSAYVRTQILILYFTIHAYRLPRRNKLF